ncbi:MAG: DUF2178 domain-containing protein [Candidatus Moduliflexus flocculans]|nr:DUF2178 domain-containing protein [Candidatus Moduliflexus flocculans]
MKRTVVMFVIGVLVLTGLALWALKGHVAGNIREIVQAGIVLLVVGFAVFLGLSRLRSHRRGEPGEDELSKTIMTKASSLAYYISIYLWLFVMYVSDKTTLEAHSLIGAGIAGMAVVFVLCWLGVKLFGMNNA